MVHAQKQGKLPVNWSAAIVRPNRPTRLYFGSDGVMVPQVTDAEKNKRRRRSRKNVGGAAGKQSRCRPQVGADQKYKEFKIVAFYDETQDHRLVCGTQGDSP